MKKASTKRPTGPDGWILFFYSVPAKPVNNRMKVWRKLLGSGAIQLKGAVYLLPQGDEQLEFVQWLTDEIAAMGGEAAFVRVAHIDTMADAELIELFNQQRTQEYAPVVKGLSDMEQRVTAINKGGSQSAKGLVSQFAKVQRGFEAVHRLDFFSSPAGTDLEKQLFRVKAGLDALLSSTGQTELQATIPIRPIEDYRGRTWVTRKKPFVDRMASAWLIKRFIDPAATFTFSDSAQKTPADAITFDMPGGAFTHVGDLCTFEVLLKTFGLMEKTLTKMAELIHDLDLKDGKYGAAEAEGVETILTGIRNTAADDQETLRRGMEIFEMLFLSQAT
ncbi:MAG: chromate resistance protein ChrB domain-containing protein [Thermodesulfobacteriota bacterium]